MRSWVEFWNGDHPIYVNARHKALHAANIERDIRRHIPTPEAIVLDYGCGEALYAEALAPACGQLLLCEAAPRICEALARRLAGTRNVRVVDPVGAAQIGDGSVDLIVANSLLQYLQKPELEVLLDLWAAKLKPTGTLILADVIPPDVSPLADASALLRFAAGGGFVLGAFGGLVRTALSDYGRIRKELGFSTYREQDIVALAAAHGLSARRITPNFGHNQARMTFEAVKAA